MPRSSDADADSKKLQICRRQLTGACAFALCWLHSNMQLASPSALHMYKVQIAYQCSWQQTRSLSARSGGNHLLVQSRAYPSRPVARARFVWYCTSVLSAPCPSRAPCSTVARSSFCPAEIRTNMFRLNLSQGHAGMMIPHKVSPPRPGQ
jgi:hypothetical protein